MEQQPQLNDHNKQEYPPMHIVEMNTSLINRKPPIKYPLSLYL